MRLLQNMRQRPAVARGDGPSVVVSVTLLGDIQGMKEGEMTCRAYIQWRLRQGVEHLTRCKQSQSSLRANPPLGQDWVPSQRQAWNTT